MTDAVLVLNAGSSSVKFTLYGIERSPAPLARRYHGEVDGIGAGARFHVEDAHGAVLVSQAVDAAAADHEQALGVVLLWIERETRELEIVAAGHRVVHGGARFAAPVALDVEVVAALEALVPLAPLHQPHNLAGIRALTARRRDLPQVACFDTAFHRTQPAVAEAYALPRALTESGIRRYGFHGLSYEHVAGALPGLVGGAAAEGRVVVAHLGAGSSMCAMRGRRSVATTMGFTALDGLPMATRSGAIDPGVLLYLMAEHGAGVTELTDLLYHRSGLLGVSGVTGDMRALLADASPGARDAVDLFVYRVGRELGSLAAALGGLDVLVFTGGIGEHAAAIRARIAEGAAWLGVRVDDDANARHAPRISAPDSGVTVTVIPADEAAVIARHTVSVVLGSAR